MRWNRVLLLSLLAGVGCYSPNYGSGDVTCGPAGECPAGQECHTDDNRCYPAHVPGPQPGSPLLGVTAGGGGTGTTAVSGKARVVISVGQPVVGVTGDKVETGVLAPAKIQ